MEAQVQKLYNKNKDGQKIEKGVAFPVCISVNDVVCNHSPLTSEELVSAVLQARVINQYIFVFSPMFCCCRFVRV